MAFTQLLWNPPAHTLNCRGAGNLVHRSRFSACLGYGPCYPGTRSRLAVCRPVVCGCMASGSAAGGRRQMELQEWGGEIGSDVPFFFSNGATYCTGRDEVVQDILPPIPLDMPMVLIKPPAACPPAEVYKWLKFDQTSSIDPLMLLEKVASIGISQDVCINDLEARFLTRGPNEGHVEPCSMATFYEPPVNIPSKL